MVSVNTNILSQAFIVPLMLVIRTSISHLMLIVLEIFVSDFLKKFCHVSQSCHILQKPTRPGYITSYTNDFMICLSLFELILVQFDSNISLIMIIISYLGIEILYPFKHINS